MKSLIISKNYEENKYCIYCKKKIAYGEKHITFFEKYFNELIDKYYHISCWQLLREE